MALVQTTTSMISENSDFAETNNAIHQDTMKRPSEIVSTNLIGEDDHQEDSQCKEAKVQGKEEKEKSEMAMTHATATSIGDNAALAETNTAFNQDKVQVPSEIILANPYEVYAVWIDVPAESSDFVAPQNIHIPLEVDSLEECATLGEKEEKREVHIEVAQNTIHQDKVRGSPETALAKPFEGSDTALEMTTKGNSISLHPPHASPPDVDPSMEEYANFRDIGSIKRKHIPLLEDAIAKYPSLWTWRNRFKRSHMKLSGYVSLGDMLKFLASTKWKDLTKEKNAGFESLVDELEAYEFDVQWLQKTCGMIEHKKLDDKTINRMKTLEAQVMEQEIEVQKAKAKLEETKLELEAIRAKVGKFDDFIGF